MPYVGEFVDCAFVSLSLKEKITGLEITDS